MKITGIIAEYNPFHKGHQYHLEQTRKQTEADFCMVIMSGDFVQRGTPAILDKYTRTRMALEGGADLVFELPCAYATASAELFSEAAITFFQKTGCVDALCFGSEQASLPLLSRIARILNDEPEGYRVLLQQQLKEGLSYPRAVYGALTRFLLESDTLTESTIEQAYKIASQLSYPNNILGIEYLKALFRLGSTIEPFCIHRKGSSHHSAELTDHELGSSSAIRELIESGGNMQLIRRHVPEYSFEQLSSRYQVSYPIDEDDLSPLLNYRILMESSLEQTADMTKDLAMRIRNHSLEPASFSEWSMALKTKNITHTHVCRALLHTVLQITKEDMISYRQAGLIPYARLLGFRKEAEPVLSLMKKTSQIPIVTKVADAERHLSPEAMQLFRKDLQAAELYRSLVYQRYRTSLPDEYRAGMIRI
ncbi:MAG: nucleotidyltransferase [Lachnospiraceae bacterium]|nr:nucleotidyltransferase [Lachnospiraceae bacterium]